MPSLRHPALNPRAPTAPPRPAVAQGPTPEPPGDAKAVSADGGFHESSYELQHGLQITESAWPEDVTVPGHLGDH